MAVTSPVGSGTPSRCRRVGDGSGRRGGGRGSGDPAPSVMISSRHCGPCSRPTAVVSPAEAESALEAFDLELVLTTPKAEKRRATWALLVAGEAPAAPTGQRSRQGRWHHRAVYQFIRRGDEVVEVCDECGFNGALVDIQKVPAALSRVRDEWAFLLEVDEALLRARPAPATWCGVEYGRHTASALRAVEWGARQIAKGVSPDWRRLPDELPPDATSDNHGCESVGATDTLADLQGAVDSLVLFTGSLSAPELTAEADYGGGLLLSTSGVIRHGLHDAEHHVLDVRRGIARLLLFNGR